MDGAIDAARDRQRQKDDDGAEHKLEGRRELVHDHVERGALEEIGIAQIALHRPAEKAGVLHEERVIEAHFRAHFVAHLFRDRLADKLAQGIAEIVLDGKPDQRDDEHHDHGLNAAPEQKGDYVHECLSEWGCGPAGAGPHASGFTLR